MNTLDLNRYGLNEPPIKTEKTYLILLFDFLVNRKNFRSIIRNNRNSRNNNRNYTRNNRHTMVLRVVTATGTDSPVTDNNHSDGNNHQRA